MIHELSHLLHKGRTGLNGECFSNADSSLLLNNLVDNSIESLCFRYHHPSDYVNLRFSTLFKRSEVNNEGSWIVNDLPVLISR